MKLHFIIMILIAVLIRFLSYMCVCFFIHSFKRFSFVWSSMVDILLYKSVSDYDEPKFLFLRTSFLL